MISRVRKYRSIKVLQFFMTIVSFWYTENRKQQILLNINLAYVICATFVCVITVFAELYTSQGDAVAFASACCTATPVLLIVVKLSTFIWKRTKIIDLIKYTNDNFVCNEENSYDIKVMDEIDRKGFIMVILFTIFAMGTVVFYTVSAVRENIGKYGIERVLIFRGMDIILNIELLTPYFEVLFLTQAVISLHAGICFCCFDHLLIILSLIASGQLRILQHNIERIEDRYRVSRKQKENIDISNTEELADDWKNCVRKHNEIIYYIEELDNIFNFIILVQLLVSSVMLCFVGVQAFLVNLVPIRRAIYIIHMLGDLSQLFFITSSCHEVMLESVAIADVAYGTLWYIIPCHKSLRYAIVFMIRRSQKCCCLYAGRFFQVSLNMFSSVLSTTCSYFALIRQMI